MIVQELFYQKREKSKKKTINFPEQTVCRSIRLFTMKKIKYKLLLSIFNALCLLLPRNIFADMTPYSLKISFNIKEIYFL